MSINRETLMKSYRYFERMFYTSLVRLHLITFNINSLQINRDMYIGMYIISNR